MTSIHLTRLDNRRATVKNQGSHKLALARSLVFSFQKKRRSLVFLDFQFQCTERKKKDFHFLCLEARMINKMSISIDLWFFFSSSLSIISSAINHQQIQ